jgi:urease alpha subunit
VIAVGSVGFMLLAGRIDVRRAAQVILGCFVLFGASTIAAGFVRFAESGNVTATIPPSQPSPLLYASPVAKTPTTAVPYDPYAGAALPTR